MPPILPPGKLVIASHNTGKIREIDDLLTPFGMEVVSAYDLGLEDVEETGTTFIENARLKAHAAMNATGLPAISDDSGLCVTALDGAPGIYSARWAEDETGNRDFVYGMQRLADALTEKDAQDYGAWFTCALCLALPGGTDYVFEGNIHGQLTFPPRGEKGFGYDAIFLAKNETQTFGEMDPVKKHAMSHRADAFKQLVATCFNA